jgi:hypothetical protein
MLYLISLAFVQMVSFHRHSSVKLVHNPESILALPGPFKLHRTLISLFHSQYAAPISLKPTSQR